MAAPVESAEAVAAAAALSLRLDVPENNSYEGWLPLAIRAFAALQSESPDACGRESVLLWDVVCAAHMEAESSRSVDRQDADAVQAWCDACAAQLPPPSEYADWVLALLSGSREDAPVCMREYAAEAFVAHLDSPGEHPAVAAAAARVFAVAAAAGRTHEFALYILSAFGQARKHCDGDEACARAVAAEPGCVAALVACLTSKVEYHELYHGVPVACACHALQALCRWPDTHHRLRVSMWLRPALQWWTRIPVALLLPFAC